jgi:acyl dehydratase
MIVTGFEQFAVGQVFTSAPRSIDATAIKAFAAQFDTQAQHMDEDAAQQTLFGSLVASGWHTAALTMRLMLDSAIGGVSGRALGVRINDITWSLPVRPGDELRAVSEVMELRPSRSKPDRGLVVMRTTTINQTDEPVQQMTGTLMVLRSDAVVRPPHSAA